MRVNADRNYLLVVGKPTANTDHVVLGAVVETKGENGRYSGERGEHGLTFLFGDLSPPVFSLAAAGRSIGNRGLRKKQ